MAKNKREHGQGTIYLRKDGRWYGAVQNGYNENGKPKMITVYGKTEAETKRKLKEKIKLINSNGLILQDNTVENITVEEYCTNWLENVKVNELKPSSYDRKEMTLSNQVYPSIGMLQLSQLSIDDVQGMINQLKKDELSYSSIKKAYEAINECCKYAMIRGDLQKKPLCWRNFA